MANYIDPNADGANNAWTKSTGTAGWSLLDDAVRQPTAPSTGTDRITSSTSGQLQDLAFPNTLTHSAGATYTLWFYAIGGNRRGFTAAVSTNDGTSFGSANTIIAASTSPPAAQWYSLDISSLITSQATLDGLRVRLACTSISGGGATAVEIDAIYLEQVTATVYTDADTVPLALTPSAVEGHEISDSESEYLNLVASSVEGRESADSETVPLSLSVYTAPLIFGSTPLKDDFNRADGAPGSSWQVANLTITGNQVVPTVAAGGGQMHWLSDLYPPDTEASMVFPILPTVPNGNLRIQLRHQISVLTYYEFNMFIISGGFQRISIQKWISNVNTNITGFFAPPITLLDGDELGLTAYGDRLVGWVRRGGTVTVLARTIDSDIYLSGRHRFSITNSTDTNVAMDNYRGGPIGYDISQFVESQSVFFALTPAALEGLVTTDVATEYVGLTASGADLLTHDTVDAATEYLGLVASGVEAAGFVDSATEYTALTPSGSDVQESVDSGTEYLGLTANSSDSAELVDAQTEYVELAPSGSDIVERITTDADTEYLGLVPTSAEGVEHVDDGTALLAISPEAVDLFEGSEASQEYVSLLPSADETREQTDSDLQYLGLVPDSVESADYDDSATSRLDLSPSHVENYERVDDATATILLSPDAVEFATFSDAGTTFLGLDPASVESAEFVDAATEYLGLLASGSDEKFSPGSDVGELFLELLGSSTEVAAFADSVAADIGLDPQGADVVGLVDAATIVLALEASGSDVYVPDQSVSDAGTTYLSLAPDSIEYLEQADVGMLSFLLDPSGLEILGHAGDDGAEVYLSLSPKVLELIEILLPSAIAYKRYIFRAAQTYASVGWRRWIYKIQGQRGNG